MDCTGWSSNTGLKVVAPSVDFQTPPLAAPTNKLILPAGALKPASAEIRPLMAAEPMLRAPRPENVPASMLTAAFSASTVALAVPGAAVAASAQSPPDSTTAAMAILYRIRLLPRFARPAYLAAGLPEWVLIGNWNRLSGIVGLASTFSNCTF